MRGRAGDRLRGIQEMESPRLSDCSAGAKGVGRIKDSVAQVCHPGMLPRYATQVCHTGVQLSCATQVCHSGVLSRCAAQVCSLCAQVDGASSPRCSMQGPWKPAKVPELTSQGTCLGLIGLLIGLTANTAWRVHQLVSEARGPCLSPPPIWTKVQTQGRLPEAPGADSPLRRRR